MNNLLTQINTLRRARDHEGVYNLVEEQLKHESNDIELWISLAITIITVPIVDYETSIACLEKALAIDNNNPIALIVMAHVYHYELGGIDDILLHQIKTLHTDSNEINSMLKYVASWSYSYTKKQHYDLEEELLKESIDLCDTHVWNYVHLAKLYTRQKRYLEINSPIKKALSNIQKIYVGKYEEDITDINEFISEKIKGIYITDINVEGIQKKLIPKHIVLFYTITTPLLRFYHFVKAEILRSMNLE